MGIADFLSTPRTNLIPSVMEFPSADVEGLKKKLKLKDRAREQGQRNVPAPDSDAFDPSEREIIAEIERTGREQFDEYLGQQKTYAERAADATVQGQVLRISSIASSAVTDFQRETHV